MSILKKLAKKKPQMDIRKMSQVIANINKLIEMGLLKVDLSTRQFYIQQSLWENRDDTFKDNWSKSVALYWNASTGHHGKEGVFSVFDIESNLLLKEYTLKPFLG